MASVKKRVLAVSSGGGHWVQLLLLREAWSQADVAYVTVQGSYASQVPGARFYRVLDATRWDRVKVICMAVQIALVMIKERPDVVITTGAAPGVIALRLGKWLGAKTIWIDSIANVEAMSMSGEKVKGFADLRLSQWPQVARQYGAKYLGGVL